MLQIDIIYDLLCNRSYWTKGRTFEQVKKSIGHSFCFGIFTNTREVAFASVVPDFTVYGYILDVFVLEEKRGKSLGKFLMHCIVNHPELQVLRHMMLGTEDAQGLYPQFGFTQLINEGRKSYGADKRMS